MNEKKCLLNVRILGADTRADIEFQCEAIFFETNGYYTGFSGYDQSGQYSAIHNLTITKDQAYELKNQLNDKLALLQKNKPKPKINKKEFRQNKMAF